jgi:hypothetical protein
MVSNSWKKPINDQRIVKFQSTKQKLFLHADFSIWINVRENFSTSHNCKLPFLQDNLRHGTLRALWCCTRKLSLERSIHPHYSTCWGASSPKPSPPNIAQTSWQMEAHVPCSKLLQQSQRNCRFCTHHICNTSESSTLFQFHSSKTFRKNFILCWLNQFSIRHRKINVQ